MALWPISPSTRSLFTPELLCVQQCILMRQRIICWTNLIAIGQEEKLVSKQLQGCILVRQHIDFDDGQILYAVTRYCKFLQEGPLESLLFDTPSQDDVEGGEDVAVEADVLEAREILETLNKDISNF